MRVAEAVLKCAEAQKLFIIHEKGGGFFQKKSIQKCEIDVIYLC